MRMNNLFVLLKSKRYYIILLFLIILTAWIRISLIDVPLERDEGEYAYAGQLILQGSLPYESLYNMKLPGTYIVYAGIIALFGHTHQAIHTGLLIVNVATIILIFLLGKYLINPLTGIMASASFAVLSLDPAMRGIFANSEHFVILPVVGGILLLLEGLKKDRQVLLLISGLLFGTALLMKQHGALFSLFAFFYIIISQVHAGTLYSSRTFVKVFLFAAGAVIPYVLICLVFVLAGVFERFWFWTVVYALRYTSQMPLSIGWEMLKDSVTGIVGSDPLVWMVAGIGLTAPVWNRRMRKHAMFMLGFFMVSLLSLLPGFYFRMHYFLLLTPAVSLLFGVAVSAAENELSRFSKLGRVALAPVLLSAVILAVSIYQQGSLMMGMTPKQLSRSIYGLNPFPESLEIGRFIRENTKQDDNIAVIGSEPQIYFYSGRRASTGYIYMYPLMEQHEYALDMQEDMIREIEARKPGFLIYVHIDTSWLMYPESNTLVFEWLEKYQDRYYRLVGLVDISKNESGYYWGPDLKWPPETQTWIAIFERR
jgi:hypothetical protein